MFDFVIAGCQKCGTTSIYEYLKQCDSVCVPKIKEIPYFTNDELFGNKEYFDYHFPPEFFKADGIKGFAYANLLRFGSQAFPRLNSINPALKYIVILRDPKDRIFSAYKYARARGWEQDKNISTALNPDREELLTTYAEFSNLTYIKHSLYGEQLENALQFIDQKNLLILNFNDLVKNPKDTLVRVLSFIGAAAADINNVKFDIYNKAKTPRFPAIQNLLLHKNPIKSFYQYIFPQKLRLKVNRYITRRIENWNLSEAPPSSTVEAEKKEILNELNNYDSYFRKDKIKLLKIDPRVQF